MAPKRRAGARPPVPAAPLRLEPNERMEVPVERCAVAGLRALPVHRAASALEPLENVVVPVKRSELEDLLPRVVPSVSRDQFVSPAEPTLGKPDVAAEDAPHHVLHARAQSDAAPGLLGGPEVLAREREGKTIVLPNKVVHLYKNVLRQVKYGELAVLRHFLPLRPVSYTHLTLPTKA